MRYEIIERDSKHELIMAVESYLKKGWRLLGGADCTAYGVWIQTVTKEDE